MSPFWVSAFLDLPEARHEPATTFWAGVTGWTRSAPRGPQNEFSTLVPPDGHDVLRIQRVGDDGPRTHLDLHVTDPRAAAAELVALGATEVADHGYVVLTSPHGLVFCLVTHPAATRPPPRVWPAGHASLVDQVCLDIASSAYAEECAFWASATGWELRQRTPGEFRDLRRPEGQPLRFLLQRRDDDAGPVTAHLDLATTDRTAEVARHVALGAVRVADHAGWTVLRDPAGSAYCVTDRDPLSASSP